VSLPDAAIWWCLQTGGGGVLMSLLWGNNNMTLGRLPKIIPPILSIQFHYQLTKKRLLEYTHGLCPSQNVTKTTFCLLPHL
jgi:flagellar biosynthesis protein FliQ